MRAVSTLRLTDKERELFLVALEEYGYEDGASFLRGCARALIAHHRQGDKLEPVLRFQLEVDSGDPIRF
jgi:hypothetical protein